MFSPTTSLKKIAALTKKIKGIQGGTSASKTISILMLEIHTAQVNNRPGLTSVVSESLPHLKRGALRDFKKIMQEHRYWTDDAWRESDKVYTFPGGWQIEFFSVDQPDKLRGGRRDRLVINEANNVSLDAFDQLEVRTKESVFLDWNPSSEFWFYTDVLPNRTDVDHLILTYKDNEALSPEIVSAIEMRQNNKAWWQVYGLGLLGEIETRIYTGWNIIDSVPDGARLERRGLDFGYTNDPSAIISIYKYNEGYVLDEEMYRKGMSNKALADFLNNLNNSSTLVIADSAEPKSIDELKLYGINVLPAQKGPDSIRQGIQRIQDLPIFITKRSTNLIKEYRNYLWLTDKDGKVLNQPTPGQDHACFTADTKITTLGGEIIATKKTGTKNVYEFMGSKVTPDHPYLTQRGFVRLDALRYSDKIVVWKNKLLMELSLDDTQTLTAVNFVTILYLLQRNLLAIKLNAYTGIYGKNKMVQFLRVFIFITKTTIHLITTYLISNWSQLKNTIKNITKKIFWCGKKQEENLSLKPVNGLKQKTAKNLGVEWENLTQSISQGIQLQETVTSAEKNTLQKHHLESSATIIAKLKHCGKEDVYATATTNGIFLANNVLVSNCDAVRYAITSLYPNLRESNQVLAIY